MVEYQRSNGTVASVAASGRSKGRYSCIMDTQPQQEFYFQWHITERCNLRCAHCYQNRFSDSLELTLGDLKQIADQLCEALRVWKRRGRIAVTGGEPFAHGELLPLLEHLDGKDEVLYLDVLSNGTLIQRDAIPALQRLDKLRRVQVSLDGATPDIHDAIRGTGTFERAIEGIRRLRSAGLTVTIMFTLHRRNAVDVPRLLDLVREEGVSALVIERLVPCGMGKGLQDEMLTPKEISSIFSYVSDRADVYAGCDAGPDVLRYRTLWALLDPQGARATGDTPPAMHLGAMCSVGMDGLCIMPDGTALPCRRLPIPLGNIRTDGIFKIWYTSDLLWKIRDKRNLKGKCGNCELVARCGGCRAIAYACTGDYLEEDPQCWKPAEVPCGS